MPCTCDSDPGEARLLNEIEARSTDSIQEPIPVLYFVGEHNMKNRIRKFPAGERRRTLW
jgi:hypothetical protein